MAQQSSRLHRLLTLLDTGSTQATRLAAARQIGDIAKSHPHELNSLLKKVSQYLRSRNWETRVAAAHAIGAIAENAKHTSLKELLSLVETEVLESELPDAAKEVANVWSNFHPSTVSGLSFSRFDINKVLDCGQLLLASAGQEYDVITDNGKNPAERLARQKQNLHRRLGLDVCEQFMDFSDMIKDEDLIVQKGYPHGNGINREYYASSSGQNIQQLVANMVPSFRPKRLSARELNLLKRKAKINAKDQTKGWSEDDDLESPHSCNYVKGTCPDPVSQKISVNAAMNEDICEHNGSGEWPFYQFVEQLIHDIFDPVWEIRHGATMALREILTRQGSCAGVHMPNLTLEMSWLDDDLNNVYQAKRTRELDLNTQSPIEEYEAHTKRRRLENDLVMVPGSNSLSPKEVNLPPQLSLVNEVSATVGRIDNVKHDIKNIKVEPGLPMSGVEIVDDSIANVVKVETMLYVNGFDLEYEQGNNSLNQKLLSGDECSTSKTDYNGKLPESGKLKKLVKLARHSWIKNWEFLQDCAIRFLCVLALDRFGDFVSDQVVAPVRETCAQALGAVIKYMHPSLVHETLNVLLQMQHRQEWEVRHGSLLGVKYLVAVREDMLHSLLVSVLPACKAGLEDTDDDVRAVAAEALIPASAALVSLEGETLHGVVTLLWDILLDLDDLSPSTSSVMNLLAEIYCQPEMVSKMRVTMTPVEKQEIDLNEVSQRIELAGRVKYEENPCVLSTFTPRLWPFMRHSITSVRHSAVRTLERLLEVCYNKLSGPGTSAFQSVSILGDTLRIIFQNLLLESVEEILQCSERVWRLLVQCSKQDLEGAALMHFCSWLELATTPSGSVLNASKMFFPVALPRKSHFKADAKMRAAKLENDYHESSSISFARESSLLQNKEDLSINFRNIVVGAESEKSVTCMRVVAASALGIFASKLSEPSLQSVIEPLWNDLTSLSGFRRQVAAMILIAWFKELKRDASCGGNITYGILNPIRHQLLELLACTDPAFPTKDSGSPYAELSRTYKKMRNEALQLFHLIDSSSMLKGLIPDINLNFETLGVDAAIGFASKLSLPTEQSCESTSSERRLLDDAESLKQQLLSTSGYLNCLQTNLHVAVTSLIAAAVIWMSELPPKLNPIILPLMAAIKREKEEILQEKAAEALAELVFNCVARKPSPNDKLVKNILSLTCMDPSVTPQVSVITSVDVIEDQDLLSFELKSKAQVPSSSEDRSRREGFISRRGSELTIKHFCQKFGPSLFDKLPKLWECLIDVLKPINPEGQFPSNDQQMILMVDNNKDPQSLINNIQAVQSVASVVDEALKPQILSLLPCIICCVRHCHVAVRLAASRCITSMSKSMTSSVMRIVVEKVIPMLQDEASVHARQGAGMLLSLLVQGLGVELVPYAPLLVVPLLRCMGDSERTVRQSVTHSFAALVPLLPLARGVHPPIELSDCLTTNTEDVKFLEQLLDNSHIEDYKLPINLKVELRRYQKEGINWLSFLRRFKLHGILCDDMGLGKTLQASTIIASDIAERRVSGSNKDVLSLIICPSTLVGHWAYEIDKYIDESVMTTLQYVGSSQERISLRKNFEKYNVIITSYDVVRKDIDFLEKISWNYCILDEGHIIKNSKSKITVSIKQLRAEHRLILSGTPIQNNVLELWSLFDFLMPGFLGTERQFQATYGKPLLAAKDSKCSAKDAEAGVLAMEALHKQVMPFLLRRTKDEVLSDLPEKIIQDRYCDLSPVQLKLYDQFSSSNVQKEVSDLVKVNEVSNSAEPAPTMATSHVFQALQYLLKLCSHPLLVLGERPPDSIMGLLSGVFPGSSDFLAELHEVKHSPKLVALQEILEECGVGIDASSSDGSIVVGQHRVLIFAQHRAFLDIIERDLFQARMKSVTYLRLDGSVEPVKRFDIVKTFNSDPTIDVLLLTTHVGGLGLNLTSADTLVFMEHDWNPMKDHQAMDRAHRLGQRKVVNVHRLIMRGTLEEKVMSLQRFKVSVANAIINADNASLNTMNTDQLLDLFTPAQTAKKGVSISSSSNDGLAEVPQAVAGKKGLKAMVSGLEELWDQSQYTEEYNLSQFLAKLNG